jgi:hypothetical protein
VPGAVSKVFGQDQFLALLGSRIFLVPAREHLFCSGHAQPDSGVVFPLARRSTGCVSWFDFCWVLTVFQSRSQPAGLVPVPVSCFDLAVIFFLVRSEQSRGQ